MTFDLSLMIFFGAVGYLMRKFEYEASSLILAFTRSLFSLDSPVFFSYSQPIL